MQQNTKAIVRVWGSGSGGLGSALTLTNNSLANPYLIQTHSNFA